MTRAPLDLLRELAAGDGFVGRHIGPDATETAAMLRAIGVESLEQLVWRTLPDDIRLPERLKLPEAIDEAALLAELAGLAAQNQRKRSLIGMGYHGTHTPPVIQRNVLENPGWYTAYTPYQAEIAQGRLEALLNFQTMICDLTGMPIANASLLDEATAAAEAVSMARAAARSKSGIVAVAADLHPQTRAVLATRAAPLGFELRDIAPGDTAAIAAARPFALVLQYPGTTGAVRDLRAEIAAVQAGGGLAIVAADLLSLILLTPPGEMGADVVVGSAQRFGVSMGYGGPHAAFFATSDVYRRSMPGRLVGVSVDAAGAPALRLALQTREQHIRREKATSNICTAQVLLALMTTIFLTVYGKQGMKELAEHNLAKAAYLKGVLGTEAKVLFDGAPRIHEFVLDLPQSAEETNAALLGHKIIGGLPLQKWYPELGPNASLWCATELTTRKQMDAAAAALAGRKA